MQWVNRVESIKSCISDIPADIYCLQEVDHYTDAYEPFFNSIGYTSLYLQRPRKRDGCLIAFSPSDYELLDRLDIQCDDIANAFESSNRRKRFLRQNVALAVKLQCKKSKEVFIVATCHVYWNPQMQEVKIAQVLHILQQLRSFSRKDADVKVETSSPIQTQSTDVTTAAETAAEAKSGVPLILCGDFNTLPEDEIYGMLVQPNNTQLLRSKIEAQDYRGAYYGPDTKFLCDASLSKLCKWMRVLGVNVAMDSWENGSSNHYKYTTNSNNSNNNNPSAEDVFDNDMDEPDVVEVCVDCVFI